MTISTHIKRWPSDLVQYVFRKTVEETQTILLQFQLIKAKFFRRKHFHPHFLHSHAWIQFINSAVGWMKCVLDWPNLRISTNSINLLCVSGCGNILMTGKLSAQPVQGRRGCLQSCWPLTFPFDSCGQSRRQSVQLISLLFGFRTQPSAAVLFKNFISFVPFAVTLTIGVILGVNGFNLRWISGN